MISMDFTIVDSRDDLSAMVQVLNVSHGTVAKDFGFTKENNPTNNAFIDASTLKAQLNKGIDLYAMSMNGKSDSHTKLKKWYSSQGFIETGTKDFEHLPFRVCFMNKPL
jgi:hypothetical protein